MVQAKHSRKRKGHVENVIDNRHMARLSGRPKRSTAIDSDDVVDLLIALNTSGTLEEFLDKV